MHLKLISLLWLAAHALSFSLKAATSKAPTTLSATTSPDPAAPPAPGIGTDEYDVVVIGSGIGGLSCAAMAAKYGYTVCVLESHNRPGGCAHGFKVRDPKIGDFYFDTGPSFFSGINPDYPAKSSNPLRTILDALGEKVDCIPYTSFGLKFPEGDFIHTTKFGEKGGVLSQVVGDSAVRAWSRLMENMKPLAKAVEALPTAALRADVAAILTAGPFLKNFVTLSPWENLKLTKPFESILDSSGIEKGFIKNWIDLLCFCLSGLPADGTITAEMAMMMGEFYDDGAVMDCPIGGAAAIVDALVRGLEKHGGSIFTNSHVEKILVRDGQVTGVQLQRSGRVIRARKAVVSNLSVWDLYGSSMLGKDVLRETLVQQKLSTPVGKSFMHLHVGFEMNREELEQLEAHYMYVDDWSRGVEAEDNAVLLSIPSAHDDSLAPDGYGVLHIYTPATEDYQRWEGLDRTSEDYERLKDERSQYLWTVLEKIIPDIRQRARIVQVGTPLTHKRFLNRFRGSYGPAIKASEGSFPFPNTALKGLFVCGDSCFPGIGVPAVAGSGLLAANSLSFDSIGPQINILKSLQT